MIVVCRLAVLEMYPDTSFLVKAVKPNESSTPVRASLSSRQLIIYPEMALSVEVKDRRNPEKRLCLTSKVDWAFRHSSKNFFGTRSVLITVEAKKSNTFSSAHGQLLTYLAVIRQSHFQENKID